MSVRVLVVEDLELLYEYLMNVFQNILPMEHFEFVNVQTTEAAVEALEEDWDAIIVDHHIGPGGPQVGEKRIRTGADLVTHRRQLEQSQPDKPGALLIAASANHVNNRYLLSAGADCAYVKKDAKDIAWRLKSLLNQESE
jgi:CheY-like chemotaxis protein